MVRLGWLARALLVASLGCVAVTGPGCSRDEKPAVSKKSIVELTANDLRAGVEALGFEKVTATTSRSGAYSNVTVVGFKQSDEGAEGPDGKKVLRVIVSLHDDPEGGPDRAKQLEATGAAFKREGRRTLSVQLSNRDQKEASRLLATLFRS